MFMVYIKLPCVCILLCSYVIGHDGNRTTIFVWIFISLSIDQYFRKDFLYLIWTYICLIYVILQVKEKKKQFYKQRVRCAYVVFFLNSFSRVTRDIDSIFLPCEQCKYIQINAHNKQELLKQTYLISARDRGKFLSVFKNTIIFVYGISSNLLYMYIRVNFHLWYRMHEG